MSAPGAHPARRPHPATTPGGTTVPGARTGRLAAAAAAPVPSRPAVIPAPVGASGRAVPGGAGTGASASSASEADAVAQQARHAESADRACVPGGGPMAAPWSTVPPGPAAPPRHVAPSGPAAARRGARPTPDEPARSAVPAGNGRCPAAPAADAVTGPQPTAPEADGDAATAPAVGAALPAPGVRRAVAAAPDGPVGGPVVPEICRVGAVGAPPARGDAVGDRAPAVRAAPPAPSAPDARRAVPVVPGGPADPEVRHTGASGRPQTRRPDAATAPAAPAVPTTRFAALGDSLTEGLGDPVAGGGWRGWAALLAGAAGPHGEPVDFVNVSRSGALAADVAGEQLTAARRARPHLASVVVGMNDTLRDTFDIRRVAEALDATIGALRADGTVVLTACLPDPGRMLGLPDTLARPLGRRMRAVNTVVHALSGRYGAVHVELTEHGWVTDRAAWSVDRLHPSELGHRLLAREFHTALTARGIAMGDPPSTALDGPAPSRAGSAWWMATRGTRWVVDRCTDLLPGLLALAAQEVRHRMRGTAQLLDGRERRAALAALAALPRATPFELGTSPPHAATMAG
ncbi:GDSL-type esterase/lipase family protein [Streptomyces sp. NPDC019937]|uniref:GDSL-type esterase/lipase family protein n=1 Tax=Streptomyces sp. NPDC019937 TaxID=3154787 RepID=UPI0033C7C48B